MSKLSTKSSPPTGLDKGMPVIAWGDRPDTPIAQIVLHGLTILISAFLLFEVQLVLSKFLLPQFGGGPSVWTTSLLVFQLLLLCGYGYAAFLTRWPGRIQGTVHLVILATSVPVMVVSMAYWHSPLLPHGVWATQSDVAPVWRISALLITAAGFQSVLLSATSPLLQAWISGDGLVNPYRLYALSNLGSMLALLSYPVIVERYLRLSTQAWSWTLGYAVFLLGAGTCALLKLRKTSINAPPVKSTYPSRKKKHSPDPHPRILWVALTACSSMMLSATTNLICQQMAAIPLLWVIPLSLYLLSFIICFDHVRWYRRQIFLPAYGALALLAMKTLPSYSDLSATPLLIIFCSAMFAVCMVCHGELVRMKPSPQHLTTFYLLASAGGVLGSSFVALVAPLIFNRFWEFQIALLGCGVLVISALVLDRNSWLHRLRLGWAILLASTIIFIVGAYVSTSELVEFEGYGDLIIWRGRNFFGAKTVFGMPDGRYLVHGHVLHGKQNTDPRIKEEPTTYYIRQSGIGLLLDHYPRSANQGLRVGVIGMGAGTLAAYAQPGDYYRFYEIDPQIAGLSWGRDPVFSFLTSSRSDGDLVLGDARLRMQEELAAGDLQKFDVLAVDAFSGDAIPVHLLTREAMALYLAHLRGPRSVLAFHVSNTALDLRPAVAAIAQDAGMETLEVLSAGAEHPLWVLAARDKSILQSPTLASAGVPIQVRQPIAPWTDDYSSVFELFFAGNLDPKGVLR